MFLYWPFEINRRPICEVKIGKADILIFWIDHYICVRRIASVVASSVTSVFLQRLQIYTGLRLHLYYLIQYLVHGFPFVQKSTCNSCI
jgi:hypothetical protein